jgi:hypothetical protein
MINQFTICSAYQWHRDGNGKNHSELAVKAITDSIKKRFSSTKGGKYNYNISYKRLRASAGKTMLDSILKRIENSQVVIIDITTNNKNVFIEAGAALSLARHNNSLSVYFIKEANPNISLLQDIPSDLQGYFISEYVVDGKGKITFKDNNSLRMSIESDVKDYFNALGGQFNAIDELNEIK